MLAQSPHSPLSRVSAAIAVTLASIGSVPMILAGIAINTIDPVVILTDNDRHILVTGPMGCTANERAYLQVTVTQRATGAVAQGRTRITCIGDTQQWEIYASLQGQETFQEGPATAVALAYTRDRGETTDAHQWLVNVTVSKEVR